MEEENNNKMAIIVHGGAWNLPKKLESALKDGVENAAKEGWAILLNGGSAIDAVEAALNVLELNPLFDAGVGSALNEDMEVEMDAIIVDGKTMNFGAVASVKNILHPVSLARLVMEKTSHVFLVGEGAMRFARKQGIDEVPKEKLVTKNALEEWKQLGKFNNVIDTLFTHDTVGAVAIDASGNVAAATSTGGITGKLVGRVGDTPVIGSGALADNNIGGASSTGHGESIMKVMLARHVLDLVNNGMHPMDAAREGLLYMKKRVNGHGGIIVIDRNGEIGFYYTTRAMPWAYIKDNVLHSGI